MVKKLDEALKTTHVIVDTAQGNKVISSAAGGNAEKNLKSSIASAERPPLSIKDKRTLKIVKLKKPVSQKKADDSINNGELQGLCRKWHDNGLLSEEMTMVDGEAHGKARSWHEDGSLKADVLLDMGDVLEHKFWELGENHQPTDDASVNYKGDKY